MIIVKKLILAIALFLIITTGIIVGVQNTQKISLNLLFVETPQLYVGFLSIFILAVGFFSGYFYKTYQHFLHKIFNK
jgi:uncharacterized membrane protein YciS (DUF1049 family)